MSDDRDSAHPKLLDRWLVRGAFAVVVTLQFSLINDFGYGTRWLAPFLEIALLVPLTVLSLRAEYLAWRAHTSQQWDSAKWYSRFNLVLGVMLLTVISLANARSLLLLLRALLAGATENGRALLLDATNIWATNVIVFSIWYWALDRGGPSLGKGSPRALGVHLPADDPSPRPPLPTRSPATSTISFSRSARRQHFRRRTRCR